MTRRLKRLVCRVFGHRMQDLQFDGRGRRIDVSSCGRCGSVERVIVKPRNRALRRQWARGVAKELAR